MMHVREHSIYQPEMIPCQWNGGCGAIINKNSVWKHIVVHQPKFKLRCPRGCDVFTRGDMMKRHLRTCGFTSRRRRIAIGSDTDEEDETRREEGPRGDNYNGDSDYYQ